MPATSRSRRPAGLPAFALYGEAVAPGEESLHIEEIESRSRLYRWEIAPHVHHGLYQVLWITAGAADVRLDERRLAVEGPAAVLVPPGIAHGFRFAHGTRGWVLTLSPRFLADADFQNTAPAVRTAFATPRVLPFAATENTAQRLAALFAQVDEAFARPGSADAPVATWLTRALLWHLAARGASTEPEAAGRAGRHQALFTRFVALVEAHFLEHWPVSRYASRLGMSVSRLNRLARSATGGTAIAVIHERLTREATRRLLFIEAPVSSLAAELGFDDPAYFNRFFKRRTGLTPGAYRLRHRPDSQPATAG